MIENRFFKVQNEFRDNLNELSGGAVKLYLVLRSCVNEGNGNKVFPDYEYIHQCTGLVNETIKKAIIELVRAGWIEDIHIRYNSSNEYFLSDTKSLLVNEDLIKRLEEKKKYSDKALEKLSRSRKSLLEKYRKSTTVVEKVETINTSLSIPPYQELQDNNLENDNTISSEKEHSSETPPSAVEENTIYLDYEDLEYSNTLKKEKESFIQSKNSKLAQNEQSSKIDAQGIKPLASIEINKLYEQMNNLFG